MPDSIDALLPGDDVQLIDPTGAAHPSSTHELPAVEILVEAYEQLVIGRRINDQCNALVRQGKLAVYPSSRGQEACEVAAGMVLEAGDWLFPTYRDTVAIVAKGVPAGDAVALLRGSHHSGYSSREHGVATQSTPLATQLLHAVGFAHAAKMRGEDTVVLAMCGDGATSEGDFHEALNFAAVFHVPVVFFVQNNGYAISVPLSRQSVAPSLAHKGVGYGVPGVRIDGNDFAATYSVLSAAVAAARSGKGPTLVEAVTYRIEAHTNADDANRYRDSDEVTAWLARDPLDRLRGYLESQQRLDDDVQQHATTRADQIAGELRDSLNAEVELDPMDLFAHVYAEPTAHMREQRQLLERELAAEHQGVPS